MILFFSTNSSYKLSRNSKPADNSGTLWPTTSPGLIAGYVVFIAQILDFYKWLIKRNSKCIEFWRY